MREIDTVDRQIIAKMQGDFPLCERPYAQVAEQLGIAEGELLERLERLLADKVLTRFGPMFQIERMGGAFVLAALAAPEARYEEITELVNTLPQVAHNYRRESAFAPHGAHGHAQHPRTTQHMLRALTVRQEICAIITSFR